MAITPNLSCNSREISTSIIFGNKNAFVTNGATKYAEILFSSIAIPVDNYFQLRFEIPAAEDGVTPTPYKLPLGELIPGGDGTVKVLMIVPDYTKEKTPGEETDGRLEEVQYMNWCYENELDFTVSPEIAEPVRGWGLIGAVMILSGTKDHYISNIYISNPQSFKVPVSILVGK